MQLFKVSAEYTEGFPQEVLALYDQIIKDALAQIEALGNITSIDEAAIFASVAPRAKIPSGLPQGAAADAGEAHR
jgi:hypothetical protein